uniref:Uncharacterized protein F13E6.1 n=1 Tax=Schistocephalus solidus TaxID=70667 RepID=A0A0X3PK05_SCHSO
MASGYIEDPNEKANLYPKLSPESVSPPYTSSDSRESLAEELHKVEEEIETLRLVLNAKVQRAAELRRRLGVYDFGVAKDDIRRTVETVKNSQAYQKTTTAVKTAASKTSEVVSKQWTNVRQTEAYKTVENTVGSFFKTIKNKITDNSQSSAVNEFPAATPTPVMGAGVGTASASAPPSDLPHAYFMGDDGKFVAGDGSKK